MTVASPTARMVTAMRKIFLTVTVAAQVVTVHGSGVSENAAIKDAKRAAVKQVIGTRIKSDSLMVDLELVITLKKYPVMCESAVREEFIKRGFRRQKFNNACRDCRTSQKYF